MLTQLSNSNWPHRQPTLEVHKAGEAKGRMKILDACLRALEDASEGGEKTVSHALVRPLQAHVPSLMAGQPIGDALEIVFSEQERCLGIHQSPFGEHVGARRKDSGQEAAPLVYDAARKLTDRIKQELAPKARTCMLLLEAHDRRAWAALGYSTWAYYVRGEFGLSRSRSYELLDQGRVIRVLREASGMSGIPDISAHWAVTIKPHLDNVVAEIRDKTESSAVTSAQARTRILRDVVEQRVAVLARDRPPVQIPAIRPDDGGLSVASAAVHARDGDPFPTSLDPGQLRKAIAYLSALPPVEEVIRSLGGNIQISDHDLRQASRWLGEFALSFTAGHVPPRSAASLKAAL